MSSRRAPARLFQTVSRTALLRTFQPKKFASFIFRVIAYRVSKITSRCCHVTRFWSRHRVLIIFFRAGVCAEGVGGVTGVGGLQNLMLRSSVWVSNCSGAPGLQNLMLRSSVRVSNCSGALGLRNIMLGSSVRVSNCSGALVLWNLMFWSSVRISNSSGARRLNAKFQVSSSKG